VLAKEFWQLWPEFLRGAEAKTAQR
jgi:hypothetical protein